MKKLEKNFKKNHNTVESFSACTCRCGSGCSCSYCAATWDSQKTYDFSQSASEVTYGPEII